MVSQFLDLAFLGGDLPVTPLATAHQTAALGVVDGDSLRLMRVQRGHLVHGLDNAPSVGVRGHGQYGFPFSSNMGSRRLWGAAGGRSVTGPSGVSGVTAARGGFGRRWTACSGCVPTVAGGAVPNAATTGSDISPVSSLISRLGSS